MSVRHMKQPLPKNSEVLRRETETAFKIIEMREQLSSKMPSTKNRDRILG